MINSIISAVNKNIFLKSIVLWFYYTILKAHNQHKAKLFLATNQHKMKIKSTESAHNNVRKLWKFRKKGDIIDECELLRFRFAMTR